MAANEMKKPEKVSLLTIGFNLNITTNNQGNHCVIAHNEITTKSALQSGNQVLDRDSGEKNCQAFSNTLSDLGTINFVSEKFAWLFKL